MTNPIPTPIMKLYDSFTNIFRRLSKKSKTLSLDDIDYLYGIVNYKYYANCLLYSQKPCYIQFVAIEKDLYGRTWHINGPWLSKEPGEGLYMWVGSSKQFDTTQIQNYPSGYVYESDLDQAPPGLSEMATVIKIRLH